MSVGRAWLAAVFLAGCSATSTQAVIQVSAPAGTTQPSSVVINVFDGYGRIGHAEIAAPKLPGTITVSGLPVGGAELRVVAIATHASGELLGGMRVQAQRGQRIVAQIALAAGTPDGDVDLVPDDLDDCPVSVDPLQENAVGSGAGDACRPAGSGNDLAIGGADDLATGSTDQAGVVTPPDMAQPPDMTPPPSLCAGAGVPFCDGFESASFNAHWAGTVQSNGTVTLDNTRGYRGTSSLHLHQNALAASAFSDVEIYEEQTFPATHLWIRAFVFVPTVFATDDADFIFVEQNVNPYDGILLGLQGTSFHTANTVAGTRKTSTTTMPRNQWVCLEWEVQLGPTGSTALSVDGAAANNLGGAQNLATSPAAASLGLSLVATAGASGIAARDLWVDEIIVDTQAIGCTK